MYCSLCGSAVKRSLRYCNHCGNELIANQSSSTSLSPTSQESIAWALAIVTIVGLGTTIGVMALMKQALHFPNGLIIAFSLLFMLAFLAADSVFVWLLLRSKRDAKETDHALAQPGFTTRDLDEAPARILPEPAISITEHSTRNLELVEKQMSKD